MDSDPGSEEEYSLVLLAWFVGWARPELVTSTFRFAFDVFTIPGLLVSIALPLVDMF